MGTESRGSSGGRVAAGAGPPQSGRCLGKELAGVTMVVPDRRSCGPPGRELGPEGLAAPPVMVDHSLCLDPGSSILLHIDTQR